MSVMPFDVLIHWHGWHGHVCCAFHTGHNLAQFKPEVLGKVCVSRGWLVLYHAACILPVSDRACAGHCSQLLSLSANLREIVQLLV